LHRLCTQYTEIAVPFAQADASGVADTEFGKHDADVAGVVGVHALLDETLRQHTLVQLLQQQCVLCVPKIVLCDDVLMFLFHIRRLFRIRSKRYPRTAHARRRGARSGGFRGRRGAEIAVFKAHVAAVEGPLHAAEALVREILDLVFLPDHLQQVAFPGTALCGSQIEQAGDVRKLQVALACAEYRWPTDISIM
jgi:hypothetical protein